MDDPTLPPTLFLLPSPSSSPEPLTPILTLVNGFNSAEDSLNISLRDVTATGRDGRVSQLDQVYIRGSMCRTFLPRPAPSFSFSLAAVLYVGRADV